MHQTRSRSKEGRAIAPGVLVRERRKAVDRSQGAIRPERREHSFSPKRILCYSMKRVLRVRPGFPGKPFCPPLTAPQAVNGRMR
jgi:hypothetical protein